MTANARTVPAPTRSDGPQSQKSAATRATLLKVARTRFGQVGFHATGTTELVAMAAVTRGALYYHFPGKEDLFEAVFRQVADELNRSAQATVLSLKRDTWRQLIESLPAYLRIVGESKEVQRILLTDGPAVLGWKKWRTIQSEYVFAGLVKVLGMLMDDGVIARRRPEPLANLIQAALDDAAMSVAHAIDHRAASIEAADALVALVGGLRIARD